MVSILSARSTILGATVPALLMWAVSSSAFCFLWCSVLALPRYFCFWHEEARSRIDQRGRKRYHHRLTWNLISCVLCERFDHWSWTSPTRISGRTALQSWLRYVLFPYGCNSDSWPSGWKLIAFFEGTGYDETSFWVLSKARVVVVESVGL